MKKTITIVLILMSVPMFMFAQLSTIGFETGEGYSAGALHNQPSSGTQWEEDGDGNLLNVVPGVGVSGTSCLQSAIFNTSDNLKNKIIFSDGDLGGTFDKDNSLIYYSTKLKYTGSEKGNKAFNIYYCDEAFWIRTDDQGDSWILKYRYRDESGDSQDDIIQDGNGNLDLIGAGWVEIFGKIDFSTKKYTISAKVNGVTYPQRGGAWLGFKNTGADEPKLLFQQRQGGEGFNLVDDVKMSLLGPATSVSIDQSGPIQIELDQTTTLSATVLPANALDKTVSWSSGTPAVASVDAQTGEVTGLTIGSSTITVTTNDGGHTDDIDVEVVCPSAPLPAPTNLNATAGDEEAELTWNTVPGADGYTIKYGTTSGQYDQSVHVDGQSTNSHTVPDLINYTTYYFVVVANQDICESAISDEVSCKSTVFKTEYTGPNVYILTTGKNLADVNAKKENGQPADKIGPLNSIPVNFSLDITANNAEADLNACITISYDESDLGELDERSLQVFRSTDGGDTWTNVGGTVNISENKVELCGVNEFSQWTLAGTPPPNVPLTNWGIGICLAFIGLLAFLKRKKLNLLGT